MTEDTRIPTWAAGSMEIGDPVVLVSDLSPDGGLVPGGEVHLVVGKPWRPRGKYDPWCLPVHSPSMGIQHIPINLLRRIPVQVAGSDGILSS